MKNLKIFTDNIEQQAFDQINTLLDQEPFKDCKIRIMPDVHAGAGCVIGFTGDLGDKVIPNIVGVDIGCGMLCVNLGKTDLDLEKLDDIVREYVPSGLNVNDNINDISGEKASTLVNVLCCKDRITNKDHWIERSMGSLGGGNHFIEIDVDNEDNKYLVIHTGSRNLGKQVAEIYQNIAIKNCSYVEEMKSEKAQIIKDLKEQHRETEINDKLHEITEKYKGKTRLPKDLCYLEGKDRDNYLHDMRLCQKFAKENRLTIAKIILERYFEQTAFVPMRDANGKILRLMQFGEGDGLKANEYGGELVSSGGIDAFDTMHNYIDFKDNIVRKGAISARKGEKVLIPMNMRDGCLIAIGKGNEDWNNSAPHGAGRIMSRREAKEVLDVDKYKETMKDVYSTSVNESTIDEAPFVYKPMEEILENIKDTVDVVNIIKPIYNFKAGE